MHQTFKSEILQGTAVFLTLKDRGVLYSVWTHVTVNATQLPVQTLPVHSRSSMKLNTSVCLYPMYIICNKSTANLNMIVLHDTSTVCGVLLTELTTESGSVWTAAAIDCQHAISDVMTGAQCRHTNCNS